MAIKKIGEKKYLIRWRENGRNRSRTVNGPFETAKKIERKALSSRDENRFLDQHKEVNYRMSALVDRYEDRYASRKKSYSREKSVLNRIRAELGDRFVREVDGRCVDGWYRGLLEDFEPGTADRHFHVMHHLMEKAATIWSDETGISRNPADQVEREVFDDSRLRYLSQDELARLKRAMDDNLRHPGNRRVLLRLRAVVLVAISTGMRISEIFALTWEDIRWDENLICVSSKRKRGGIRFVPLTPELIQELRRYRRVLGETRIFPPEPGAKSGRQRLDKSFHRLLTEARITDFRFHDLRHTFASWYMMNGGDLYELAKILGHANISMTEKYAKLGRQHLAKTGATARAIWTMMEATEEGARAAV